MKIFFNKNEKKLNFEMILGVEFDQKSGKFLESAHQEVSKTAIDFERGAAKSGFSDVLLTEGCL